MAFGLDARPNGEYAEEYYENWEWPNGEYARSPSYSAKHVRDSDILPDALISGLYGDIKPEEAVTYADNIEAAIREHDDADADHLGRLARFAHWLRYWGNRNVKISGGP